MWTLLVISVAVIAIAIYLARQQPGSHSVRLSSTTRVTTYAADDPDARLPQFQSVAATFAMEFTDRQGQLHSGVHDIWGFGVGEQSYIRADGRDGARSVFAFIKDVRSVSNPETGEVIPDLVAALKTAYDFDPERIWSGPLSGVEVSARILIYAAKIDGQFSASERAVVTQTILSLSSDQRATAEHVTKAIKKLPTTNLTVFRRLCGELAKQAESVQQAVLRALDALRECRKSESADFISTDTYIRQRLSQRKK